jgi:hypothetical protein
LLISSLVCRMRGAADFFGRRVAWAMARAPLFWRWIAGHVGSRLTIVPLAASICQLPALAILCRVR